MQTMAQVGVILSAVGVVGSVGGYETGMYGFGGWMLRLAVSAVMLMVFGYTENALEQRKRAKRVAARKARKNNKYEVICH